MELSFAFTSHFSLVLILHEMSKSITLSAGVSADGYQCLKGGLDGMRTAARFLNAILTLCVAVLCAPVFAQGAGTDRDVLLASLSGPGNSGGVRPEVNKLEKGIFLVAGSRLKGGIFGRSVILLVSHDQNGAMGLIINKPTGVKLADLLADVKEFTGSGDRLYLGGPVALNSFFLLAQSPVKPDEAGHIIGNVYISRSLPLLKRMAEERRRGEAFRLYTGYAGWGPGQLEAEVLRGDWLPLSADPALVFDKDPDGIWERLMPQKMDI
jgi:putative transcriptional regulator